MKKQLIVNTVAMLLVTSAVVAYVWQDADLNGDWYVDSSDLGYWAWYSGSSNCSGNNSWCYGADINEDSFVDSSDLGILAHYLGCNNQSNTSNESQCGPI